MPISWLFCITRSEPVCCCHIFEEASASVSSGLSVTAAAVMMSETFMTQS
jgi:hypothetical protein